MKFEYDPLIFEYLLRILYLRNFTIWHILLFISAKSLRSKLSISEMAHCCQLKPIRKHLCELQSQYTFSLCKRKQINFAKPTNKTTKKNAFSLS